MNQEETKTTTTTIRRNPRPRKPTSPEALLHKTAKILESCLDAIDPEHRLSSDVRRLIDKPSLYDQGATIRDRNELLSVKFVPSEQVGALPALHARWQHASTLQNPSEEEAAALTKAGFIVEDYDDDTGPFCYYRERRISHAWVILSQDGWKWSKTRSAKAAKWETLTMSKSPTVPSLPGCPYNHRTILRDSLIEATVKLKDPKILPWKVWDNEAFSEVMLALWEHAVAHVEGHNVSSIAAVN